MPNVQIRSRWWLLLLLLLCLSLCCFAENARGQGQHISGEISRLIASYQKQNPRTQIGVSIVDIGAGKSVYTYNSNTALIPASNQKLLTTVFALQQLGMNFEFRTKVLQLGQNIIIVGDFDPTLGDPVIAAAQNASIYAELDIWAASIKKAVGSKIFGDLILFNRGPQTPYHTDWPRRHRFVWYGAPIAALNFHDNCFDVFFKFSKLSAGHKGKIIPCVSPSSKFIKIVDDTKPGKKQVWRLISNSDDSVVTVRGKVRSASKFPLSTPASNPPMLLGRTLTGRLADSGVTLGGKICTVTTAPADPGDAIVICETKTPLVVAVNRANKKSLNLAAECLFLRAGDGTWKNSATIMTETLLKNFELDANGLTVRDGAGLSRQNRVSPANITKLLADVIKRDGGQMFLNSLPRSGLDGTMRRRMKSAAIKGRVSAKTGYLSGVVALSGYVVDPQGRPVYAFSILLNKVRHVAKARRLQDNICKILVQKATSGGSNRPTAWGLIKEGGREDCKGADSPSVMLNLIQHPGGVKCGYERN